MLIVNINMDRGGIIILLDLLVIAVIIAEDYFAINCGTTTSYTITAYGKGRSDTFVTNN